MESHFTTPAIKQEPSPEASSEADSAAHPSFSDGFLGAALWDSLRNVPDPMAESSGIPRGRKNPTVTLDSMKKELTYECELCGKRFRKSADFYQHKQTHGEPLKCEFCLEQFYKPWDLTKHQMEKHSSSQMHFCQICGKSFIEHWRLLRHLRTHSNEKKFKCEMCDKSFTESGNLAKHKKQVHFKDRPFKCDFCDKSYPQKKDLQGHMLIHTMKRFTCQICGEKFAQVEEKRAHVAIAHARDTTQRKFVCTVCDATFNNKFKYKNHIVTHGERRFECRICLKKFHTNGSVGKHMRCHQVEGFSRCEVCDKSFSQACNLKRHIEVMHMQGDKFVCTHCPSTFETSDELRSHREATHQDELPYKCDFCEKAFSHLQSLVNHSKCHRNPERHLKEFVTRVPRKRQSKREDNLCGQKEGMRPVDGSAGLLDPLQVRKRGRPRKNVITATVTRGETIESAKSGADFPDTPMIKVENCSEDPEQQNPTGTMGLVTVIKTEDSDIIELGQTYLQDS